MTTFSIKPKQGKPQPEKKPIERIYTRIPAKDNDIEEHQRIKTK